MDLTPPSHRSDPRPKSASRLAQIGRFAIGEEETRDLIPASPKKTPTPSPSPRLVRELLLLSPSPRRRTRTRLADRLESEEVPEPAGSCRRRKSRGAQMGLLGCASPRGNRRPRRRPEPEIREDKDLGVSDEVVKVRKKRNSVKSKKEKPNSIPKTVDCAGSNLDRIGQSITDLIMWKDVAKSTLWFGFGSICFLSSCFTRGLNFNIFSAISQLGLLLLGASFFSNSICQRNNAENGRDIHIKEDDILRVATSILPATNMLISKIRDLFSGEPATTLKVVPFLLLGAEYGHLITLWRLSALGFFIGFSVPKLYSNYTVQINQKAESMKCWVMDTWRGCSYKKIVATSAAMAFWNLSSVKTRFFTAFIALVIFRYCRNHLASKLEGDAQEEEVAEEEQEQQHAQEEEVAEQEQEQQQALEVAKQ